MTVEEKDLNSVFHHGFCSVFVLVSPVLRMTGRQDFGNLARNPTVGAMFPDNGLNLFQGLAFLKGRFNGSRKILLGRRGRRRRSLSLLLLLRFLLGCLVSLVLQDTDQQGVLRLKLLKRYHETFKLGLGPFTVSFGHVSIAFLFRTR